MPRQQTGDQGADQISPELAKLLSKQEEFILWRLKNAGRAGRWPQDLLLPGGEIPVEEFLKILYRLQERGKITASYQLDNLRWEDAGKIEEVAVSEVLVYYRLAGMSLASESDASL